MKIWSEPAYLRRRIVSGVIGGLAGMALVPLVAVVWLNSMDVLRLGAPLVVRQSVLEALGWPWQGLLALELVLSFAFGASVGVAVPPMEGTGRAVAARTVAHLAVSSALYGGLCAVCGLWPKVWAGRLVVLALYWFAYGLVWLLRYLSWRSELEAIREKLGLSVPAPAQGIFQIRSLRPYLLLAAGVELLLPYLLLAVDARDFPVLTGLAYPYLLLPFFCAATGWSVGRRFGAALLYPAACALLTVPVVLLIYNTSALFQVGMAGVPALAGVLIGAAVQRRRQGAPPDDESNSSGKN